MPSVSELLSDCATPGRASVTASSEKRGVPSGPDRFLRYLTVSPSRNTLSGNESPSTSTSASTPSSSPWPNPTFRPMEPDLLPEEPTPTYRWPPKLVLLLAFRALASPTWSGERFSAPLDRLSLGDVQGT